MSNANADRWAAMKQMQLVAVTQNQTVKTKWGTFRNMTAGAFETSQFNYDMPGTWKGKVFLLAVTNTGFVDTRTTEAGKSGVIQVRNTVDYYTSVSIFILPEYGPEPREWLITRKPGGSTSVLEKVSIAGERYEDGAFFPPARVTVNQPTRLSIDGRTWSYMPGDIIGTERPIQFPPLTSPGGEQQYAVLTEVK